MDAATRGATDDDEIVTMDVVEDERPPKEAILSPARARPIFLALAIVAGLALLAAIVIIATAPSSAATWLVVALVVLVLVVIAEIVLLVVARPTRAP